MLKKIKENIYFLNTVDWNRRLFDSLIPIPDGTSYNAYLVKGTEKTVLIDTADPLLSNVLFDYLKDVKKIDYIISLHTEQYHSGSIPLVLEKYPEAKIVFIGPCVGKRKEVMDHPDIDYILTFE